MYFWPCWIFTAVMALLQLQWNGVTLPCCAWALEHRLNSSGTQAQPLHSIWNPSRPAIKPTFLAPEPPGKHLFFFCLPEGTWKTASAQEYTTLRTCYGTEHLVLMYSTSHTNAHSNPYHLDYSTCSQPIVKGASNKGSKLTYTHNYI